MNVHTPGPWRFWRYGAQHDKCVLVARDEIQVAAFVTSTITEADIRLIAAAPDMLDAVQICLDAERARRKKLLPGAPATTYTDNRIKIIEAALAKAGAF